MERFPQTWEASNGLRGKSIAASKAGEFLKYRDAQTIWLVNCNTTLTFELAALKLTSRPAVQLVAIDLVLRIPAGSATLLTPIKRLLFGQVDHFIHYFRDVSGLERHFGIRASRSSSVPFKVNFLDRYQLEPAPEGEYVLCLGRSMRDFDTFFDAVEKLPFPAAITTPAPELFRTHGARFTRPLDALPKNLRILEDDGSEESMIRIVSGAKLVVIPVLKTSMVASGISTALNAMILGRCVIGTEGPGMSDVFTDEVLISPAEDSAGLAAVIRRGWEDEDLRRRTAVAGLRYARGAGGEPELYQRIVNQVAALFSSP